MKKILIFLFFSLISIEISAQIGCAVGSNLYTSRRGASTNYNPTPVTTLAPDCYAVPSSPYSPCVVKASPSDLYGFMADTIECPIDSDYLIYGFGILISLISVRRLIK